MHKLTPRCWQSEWAFGLQFELSGLFNVKPVKCCEAMILNSVPFIGSASRHKRRKMKRSLKYSTPGKKEDKEEEKHLAFPLRKVILEIKVL